MTALSRSARYLAFAMLVAAPAIAGGSMPDSASLAETSFRCSLPQHHEYPDNMPEVHLAISAKGDVHWNGTAIDEATLSDYLGDVQKSDPPYVIVFYFRVDQDTPYGVFFDVFMRVQKTGVVWTFQEIERRKIWLYCIAKKPEAHSNRESVHIAVNASGERSWNGESITRQQLTDHLLQTAHRHPQPVVVISPDAATSYKDVIATESEAVVNGIADTLFAPPAAKSPPPK